MVSPTPPRPPPKNQNQLSSSSPTPPPPPAKNQSSSSSPTPPPPPPRNQSSSSSPTPPPPKNQSSSSSPTPPPPPPRNQSSSSSPTPPPPKNQSSSSSPTPPPPKNRSSSSSPTPPPPPPKNQSSSSSPTPTPPPPPPPPPENNQNQSSSLSPSLPLPDYDIVVANFIAFVDKGEYDIEDESFLALVDQLQFLDCIKILDEMIKHSHSNFIPLYWKLNEGTQLLNIFFSLYFDECNLDPREEAAIDAVRDRIRVLERLGLFRQRIARTQMEGLCLDVLKVIWQHKDNKDRDWYSLKIHAVRGFKEFIDKELIDEGNSNVKHFLLSVLEKFREEESITSYVARILTHLNMDLGAIQTVEQGYVAIPVAPQEEMPQFQGSIHSLILGEDRPPHPWYGERPYTVRPLYEINNTMIRGRHHCTKCAQTEVKEILISQALVNGIGNFIDSKEIPRELCPMGCGGRYRVTVVSNGDPIWINWLYLVLAHQVYPSLTEDLMEQFRLANGVARPRRKMKKTLAIIVYKEVKRQLLLPAPVEEAEPPPPLPRRIPPHAT